MKKVIALVIATLMAEYSAGALGSEPAGSQPEALKPVGVQKPSKNKKTDAGVRDHVNLKPVTAEQFKSGTTKNSKPGPGIRDHLNLKPVTADAFQHVAGAPRQ